MIKDIVIIVGLTLAMIFVLAVSNASSQSKVESYNIYNFENEHDGVITRIHDPQTNVFCYVYRIPNGKYIASKGYGISCVQVNGSLEKE